MSRNKTVLLFIIPFIFISSIILGSQQFDSLAKKNSNLFEAWEQSPQAKVIKAINKGSLEEVQSLFTDGAFSSCDMNNILNLVCLKNRAGILEFLLSQGFSYNCGNPEDYSTPIQVAVRSGSTACVKTLMEYGAENIQGNCAPHGQKDLAALAKATCHFDLASMLETTFNYIAEGKKNLFEALEEGSLEKITVALTSQAVTHETTNTEGYNPLTFAAKKGSLDVVSFILDQGTNPHFYLADKTKNVWAAAVSHNQWETAKLIYNYYKDKPESGWSVNQVVNDQGLTALHYAAAFQCDEKIIAWLLEIGADPNRQTTSTLNFKNGAPEIKIETGATALIISAKLKQKDAIQLFLKDPRANLNLSIEKGRYTLFFIRNIWDIELLKLFYEDTRVDLNLNFQSTPALIWLELEHFTNGLKKENSSFAENLSYLKLLLDYGADPKLTNETGQEPIAFLEALKLHDKQSKQKRKEAIALLTEAAKRPANHRAILHKKIRTLIIDPGLAEEDCEVVVGVKIEDPRKKGLEI